MHQHDPDDRTRHRIPLLRAEEPCPFCQRPIVIDERWRRTPMRLGREGDSNAPTIYCPRCCNFPVLQEQH
jgi:hypothetical protein